MKHIILSTLIVLAAFGLVFGQNENASDKTLKGSGRVNSSTLAMEFSLPLGNYPGRGINVPISINYSSKLWRMQYFGSSPDPGGNFSTCKQQYLPKFSENAASGWTTSMAAPYIEYAGSDVFFNSDGTPVSTSSSGCPSSMDGNESYPYYYVKRIIVHLPSGETHEMRPDDTATSFTNSGTPSSGPQNAGNWNAVYYSVDGSNLVYVQNSTSNVYQLRMPDGSYYDFNSSTTHPDERKAVTFTDRNANQTTYSTSTSTYPNGYWTDTLGKPIAIPFGEQPPSATDPGTPVVYSMPGLGGTFKFHWKLLKGSSAGTSGLTNFSDNLRYVGDIATCYPGGNPPFGPAYCTREEDTFLFGGGENARVMDTALFNPVVLAEIELPTGMSYKFSYDVYGRMDWIHYPTGGKENFTYSLVPTLSMLESGPEDLSGIANFGVVERNVYESEGDGSPYTWNYGAQYASPHGYRVTIENPDGTSSDRFLHRGIDAGSDGTFGYDSALAGMPYEERGFDSAGNMLSRKLTHWTYSEMNITPTITAKAQWHPRVDYEESALYQADGNGVTSTTRFEYENDLTARDRKVLVGKTFQYPFAAITSSSSGYGENYSREASPSTSPTPVPTPSPSASPMRTTEVKYLQNDSSYSASNYTNKNMYSLVTMSKIMDAAGAVVSHTETRYDESGSPTYRGNPTSVWVWDSYKGGTARSDSYPLTSTNAISTSAVFDTYGNQTSSTDALGNTTTTTFDTTYNAFPLTVTSPVPSDGTYGSSTAFVTTATFNTTTGLPLTTTDANGLKTEITYDSTTLRPRYVKYYNASSVQVGPTNETIYNDVSGSYWVKSKGQIDDSHYAETITYFDGLGRVYKTEQVDSGGNIFVSKEFDSDGRVSKISNPYREVNIDPCYESGAVVCWTTNTYDNASRVVSVTLPDGSTVGTDYGVSTSSPIGITKTITDQATKKRKGYSDAMGNMVRVVEDPASSALVTDYLFDTLGNLRKTTQGSQNRFFMHSTLGRLLFAKQVEQDTNGSFSATDPVTTNTAWSAKYEYDNNGNITKTIDANNKYVEGTYDALNRIKVRDYQDATMPDVSFYYDGKGLPSVPDFSKGKTTKVTSTASETKYMTFDIFGHLLTHRQTTDSKDYDTEYQYNIAGALVEETYPSTRKVKYTTNENGDLSQVQSKKNSNSGFSVYADAFSRDSAGNVTKMQLGNGRWETASYNTRQQVTSIGLGTTSATKDLLELSFAYDTTGNHDNNGTPLKQTIKVPGATDFVQTYTYDALNRLSISEEKQSTTTTWKQEFSYDRYGNRNFVTGTGHTTTLGSCSTAVCNPSFDTTKNKFNSGQNYSYDANGNVTQDAAGQRFGFDAENHQKEFFLSSNGGATPDATYVYDGEGRRVKKVSSTETTIFVYDGGGLMIAEYSNALATTPQVSYLTQDHLGSQRIITNESGAVTDRKDFAAFGDEATASRASGIGYTSAEEPRADYTGYQKDTESGLQFAQARYYNSTHGRYTSVDPMTASASIKNPQTFNRYSYVLNSPYKFVDPLGLISQTTGACGNSCSNYDTRMWSGGIPFDSLNGRGGERLAAPEAESTDSGAAASSNLHELGHSGAQRASSPSSPPPPGQMDDPEWLKKYKAQYPALSPADAVVVNSAISDAVDSTTYGFAAILTANFRGGAGGNAETAQGALASLRVGSINVVNDEAGNLSHVDVGSGTVYNGRTSSLLIDGDNDPTTAPISVAQFFVKNPTVAAITNGGQIFVGDKFFALSREGRAGTMIHEGVVHWGFGRRDSEFDPDGNQRRREGSLEINRRIDQSFRIRERPTIQ